MIRVGRHTEPGAVYIGRGSPLGNPFVMRNQSQEERNRVCDEFEKHLHQAFLTPGPNDVADEIQRLFDLSKTQDIVLGCFCAPKRCHGDSIKNLIDEIRDWDDDIENIWEKDSAENPE